MTKIGPERLLSFNFGLSSVQRASDIPRLPDEGVAPATNTQPVLQLDSLFDVETVDDKLQASSVPSIADPKILEPGNYAAALADARTAMLDLASTSTGAQQGVFAAALGVLEAADGDRTVLDAARRALMRG